MGNEPLQTGAPPARSEWPRLLARVRPHGLRVAAAIACALVGAAAGSAFAYLVGPLLQAVLSGEDVAIGPWTLTRGDLAWRFPALVFGVALARALAGWLHLGLMHGVAQRTLATLREDVFGHLLQLPPSWLARRHSGELLARFTSDVAQVEFAVGQALSSWARDLLAVLALLATCAVLDLRLFALCFVVLPLMVLPVSRFARALKRTAATSQGTIAELTTQAAEALGALPVVQAFGAEPRLRAGFDEAQARYLGAMKRSLFLRGAFTPTLEFMGVAGLALALTVGVRAVQAEPALAPKLLSFLAAALLMYQPLKALSSTWGQVQQGVVAASRVFEILDAPLEPDAGGEAGPLRQALRFEGASVHYGPVKALDGLTLEVPAGKLVALVGASGAGKTTALQLVLGFAAAAEGRVSWDGAPLASLSRASVRRQLAWLPQEPVLLSGPVRDNLLLAKPGASDAAVWTALERAGAADFVRALPSGLDTEVGERGAQLSGGQRQRLALARAFLREPSLLLLDEPTSALDAESEAAVQQGLAALRPGRTVLVIAHRLATVQQADLVAVLERGRLVELGAPDALLAAQGPYARMVQAAHAGVVGA